MCSIAVSKTGLVASGDTGSSSTVHVWDLKSLKNKRVFKGYHKHDVYLLKFTNNDKYLVVCGKRLITPVIIYNIEDGTIVLSTHVSQFVRKIVTVNNMIGGFYPLAEYKDYFLDNESVISTQATRSGDIDVLVDKYFILLASQKFFFFQANEYGVYEKREHLLEEISEDADFITCGCCYLMNKENPELRAYSDNDSKSLVLLTGHKDGKVLVWDYEEDEFIFDKVLSDYKHEIIEII